MNKLLLSFVLLALLVALTLSAVFNIAVCTWGCPRTIEVYSMQASLFFLVALIVWVAWKLLRKQV